MRIPLLGTIDPMNQFKVSVFAPDRFIPSSRKRHEYWSDFDSSLFENSVVFFDPDNGYETRKQRERGKPVGQEWIGHDELRDLFARMPQTSVAVVYQHRPRRLWTDVFDDLTHGLDYVHTAVVAYESNLAFVAMAGNAIAGKNIATAMKEYADRNPPVDFTSLFSGRVPNIADPKQWPR